MRLPGETLPTPAEMRWALANVHRAGGIKMLGGLARLFSTVSFDPVAVAKVDGIARRCDFHPDELNGELAGHD